MGGSRSPGPGSNDGLAAVGLAAFAITCCAALPLLAALAGGVAVATIVGAGAGADALAAVALAALALGRRRRRRSSRGDRGR